MPSLALPCRLSHLVLIHKQSQKFLHRSPPHIWPRELTGTTLQRLSDGSWSTWEETSVLRTEPEKNRTSHTVHSVAPLANIYQHLLSARHYARHRDTAGSRTDTASTFVALTSDGGGAGMTPV